MKINQAIQLLEHHQQWRKGEHDVQTDPVELTAAIDAVIKHHNKPACKKNCKCKK